MSKKFVLFITGALLAFGLMGTQPTSVVNAASDCDGNAVIYCGVYSRSNLYYKVTKGTGKEHQSASELKALFAKYNAYPNEFDSLKSGKVTKTNKVYVGDKVVATNVYTMGRHNIPGSTKISGLSYPLYKRHPSVSFIPDYLDAYVYLNYDGSMRYAVIKSCGNIVMGVVREKPAPTPVVKPKTVNLVVQKFEDVNGDKVKNLNEDYLTGWKFTVTGPNGYLKNVTTGVNGSVSLTGLREGTYTVKETSQAGWISTTETSLTKTLKATAVNNLFTFGNKRLTPTIIRKVNIIIRKFNDSNRNKIKDKNEEYLPDWEFLVTGPSYKKTVKTSSNGSVTISNVNEGTYTVTEVQQEGWSNTTGVSVNRVVTTTIASQIFNFGNKEIEVPITEETTPNTGGGDIVSVLPSTGTKEWVLAGLVMILLASGLWWVRSKDMLKNAKRRKPTGETKQSKDISDEKINKG